MKTKHILPAALFCAVAFSSAHAADAKKPNILVIWGDDIGWQNVSAYGMGTMESYDNKDSYGHMLQKNSWVFAPMGELMGKHLMTLGEYPPVQGGKTFDMSNVVQEFINKAKQ